MNINELVLTEKELVKITTAAHKNDDLMIDCFNAVSLATAKKVVREEIKECERKWPELIGDPRATLDWDNALLDLPAILKTLEEG